VTVDVHNPGAYENAFGIPCELLTARPAFVEAFASLLADEPVAVVSPDAGGVKRAERVRDGLERRLGREVPLGYLGKFRSEGVVRGGDLAGDVAGRTAILIDDLISSGTT
jgi:ribose-phosphate pyrophosphokinase